MQPCKGASCPRVEGFLTRLYPPPCWTAHHLSPPLPYGHLEDLFTIRNSVIVMSLYRWSPSLLMKVFLLLLFLEIKLLGCRVTYIHLYQIVPNCSSRGLQQPDLLLTVLQTHTSHIIDNTQYHRTFPSSPPNLMDMKRHIILIHFFLITHSRV